MPLVRCCGGCGASVMPSASSSCLSQMRRQSPLAGARSNFIVGFPGETEADVEILADFLTEARLDAIGIFGYSDEDGTEAVGLDGHHDADEIRARARAHVPAGRATHRPTCRRPDRRAGRRPDREPWTATTAEGRAECQGPEVDGSTTVEDLPPNVRIGDIVVAEVTESMGVDLVAARGEAIGCRYAAGVRSTEQLEPAERADHAAHSAGSAVRLAAAADGRPGRDVTMVGGGRLHRRHRHRPDRRRHRPVHATSSPTSARSWTRSPTRR